MNEQVKELRGIVRHAIQDREPVTVTQTKPHIKAQLAPPSVQDSLHGEARAVGYRTPNIALAGLQLIVGYEWLLSGGDKLLLGGFPAGLSGLLLTSLSGGQLPGFFAAILRGLVVPHAMFFGYLIEWGETLAGLGLIAAGLLALLQPFIERFLRGTSAAMFAYGVRLIERLAPFAATGAGLLGLSFFLLDGMPSPWFIPSIAYGGAINTGLFLAAASVVLVVSQFGKRHQSR